MAKETNKSKNKKKNQHPPLKSGVALQYNNQSQGKEKARKYRKTNTLVRFYKLVSAEEKDNS